MFIHTALTEKNFEKAYDGYCRAYELYQELPPSQKNKGKDDLTHKKKNKKKHKSEILTFHVRSITKERLKNQKG